MLLDFFFRREKLRRMDESLTVDNMFTVPASFSVGGVQYILYIVKYITEYSKKTFPQRLIKII